MAEELQLSDGDPEPLEEEMEFLQLENDFFASLLRRLAPGLLESSGNGGVDDDRPGREPLLMAEKHELLVAETAATSREIDRVQAEGELELACVRAGIADAAGQQAAETARDIAALLSLLRLPPPPAAEAASALGAAVMSAAAAAAEALHQPVTSGEGAAPPAVGARSAAADTPCAGPPEPPAPDAEAPTSAPGGAAPVLPPPLLLPTAKQLARADLRGAQLAQFLGDVLARHDANAERCQLRSNLLQARTKGRARRKQSKLWLHWPSCRLQQAATGGHGTHPDI